METSEATSMRKEEDDDVILYQADKPVGASDQIFLFLLLAGLAAERLFIFFVLAVLAVLAAGQGSAQRGRQEERN